jgi:hypothetical protein
MSPDENAVDHALLERARHVLGTSTTRDTLERALSLAIQQAGRERAALAEAQRFAEGHYQALPRERAAASQP